MVSLSIRGVHEGVEKINAVAELLFTQFEDYVFSVRGPGQSMHGVGRLPWSYGPPDDPQRLTGTDVGVTKDGKLTALYVFIDPPSTVILQPGSRSDRSEPSRHLND